MEEQEKNGKMICKHCKKIFFGRKNQKYCSTECRYEAEKEKTYTKVCPYCGDEFETHNKRAVYCSSTCASRKHADKVRGEYFCEYCGKPRYSDHPNRNRFCSRGCAQKAKYYSSLEEEIKIKNDREEKQRAIHKESECLICGKIFIPISSKHFYCSEDCTYEANLRQHRELWAAKYVPKTFICCECGKEIITKCGEPRSVYCSDECSDKALNRRYKEKRKQQMKQAYREPVSLKRLYKRDKGICKICGLPIPSSTDPTNMWSATRDHIVPLSKGGEHSMANCQLAHRMCNSLKLDTLDEFSVDWEAKMLEDPGRWENQFLDLKKQINV